MSFPNVHTYAATRLHNVPYYPANEDCCKDADTLTLIFLATISLVVMSINAFAGVTVGALALIGWALFQSDCLFADSGRSVRVYTPHVPTPNYSYSSYSTRSYTPVSSVVRFNPTPVYVPPPSYSSSSVHPIPGGRGAVASTSGYARTSIITSSPRVSVHPIPGGRGAAVVSGALSTGTGHAVPRR
jgi:hypothetical protein